MSPPRRGDRTRVTLRDMDLSVIRSLGLGLLLLNWEPAASAGVDPAPSIVTTDTPEYCQKLFDRVSQAIRATTAPPPLEVASLSTEGERMCHDGLTRGGILRLRRALLILEQGAASP
jgi:hypothetical protein